MKRIFGMAVLCFGLVLGGQGAWALTLNIITTTPAIDSSFRLLQASPYDRQELTVSPPAILLTFTRPARVEKGYIKVMDTFGTRLDGGTLEAKGNVLSTTLPELVPGRYTVRWSANCACDDDANPEGVFHFTVR